MNPLAPLRSLALALHGSEDPRHAAAGVGIGALFGLVPKGNLFGVLFFLLFFFFNVDYGLAAFSALLFTALAWLADGPAHHLGQAVLSTGFLKPVWTFLYNLPIVPLTRFNNTVVMGNLIIGLLLYAPLYYGSLKLLRLYHGRYRAQVEKWRVVQGLKGLGWYQAYRKWLG